MKICIVGLGLIGGSLGLALKNTNKNYDIVGYDTNVSHCEKALNLGLVKKIISFEEIFVYDTVFLAVPVDAIIKIISNIKFLPEYTTVIDLGSTKKDIVNSIPKNIRSNFVAAHPMAGTEKFGPTAAFETLFENKIVVLCDIENSSSPHQEKAINIFSSIKMNIVFMNSNEHDKHASLISHLPHAISYALANSVMKREDPKSILSLAAGGFKDMSRIAKSSPTMWTNIFKQNKTNLLEAMQYFDKEMKTCKKLIENDEWEKLEEWMSEATKLHHII